MLPVKRREKAPDSAEASDAMSESSRRALVIVYLDKMHAIHPFHSILELQF